MDISLRVHILVGHYVLYPIREYLPIIFFKKKIKKIEDYSQLYPIRELLTLLGLDQAATGNLSGPETQGVYSSFQLSMDRTSHVVKFTRMREPRSH